MRLRGDQLAKRVFGTCVGVGFLAFGLFSILGGVEIADQLTRGRALGFGVASVTIGLIAVVASLTVENLDAIWCRPPRRWGTGRGDRP